MTVTMKQTHEAMAELVIAGKMPNGKVAFWNARLSALNPLDRNCMQATILRTKYAHLPLPVNREELWIELGSCLFRSHINTLYEIEKLWNSGIIHFNCGHTFDEQVRWRDSMVAAIPGMGLKTVSFALHIYMPEQCLILTIDRHHLARLGYKSLSPTPKQYKQAEVSILALTHAMAGDVPGYTPLEYAACLWENWRQDKGKSKGNGGYESHAGLSCYV